MAKLESSANNAPFNLSNMEISKLEEIAKTFDREEMRYIIQFMPLDIVWNEAERRLKEAVEYKEALKGIMSQFDNKK